MVSSQNDKDLCFVFLWLGNSGLDYFRFTYGDCKNRGFYLKTKSIYHITKNLFSSGAFICAEIICNTNFCNNILVSLFTPASLPAFYPQWFIGGNFHRAVLQK